MGILPSDGILLDLCLPGMSGIDFLRLPLVRRSGVPIMAMADPGAVSRRR